MDALKKADNTKIDKTVDIADTIDTQPAVTDAEDWDEELLPQFHIDSQLDINQKNDISVSKESSSGSEKWEDELLPQFKNEQNLETDELPDTDNNLIEPPIQTEAKLPSETDQIPDMDNELIEPPIQAEVKLPNVNKLPDIDEVQTLFSLTDKEHGKEVETSQIPVLDIDEQSPLEKPIESSLKEEYQPQDAQRILTAGQTNQVNNKPKHSSKRTMWLVSILGIILIGIGAGYYYFQPLLNQSSSIDFTKLSQRPKFNPVPIEQSTPVKQPVVSAKQTIQPVKKIEPPKKITPAVAPKIKPTPKVFKPIPTQTPKVIPEQKNTIRTQHKKKINLVAKDLSTAYNALQNGNNKKARRAYQQVLRQDETNRDALLGMAALAIRNNNIPQAQQFYQLVLRKYPKDIHAQVGLINSFGNRPKNETQLKLLLRQMPKAAHIHFSLGNLYANQGRWELAQQAYFDAMRYDKKHAGYAYNLAISLDRINQPKAALTYYKQALNSANTSSFDPKVVQKRINTLTKILK
ncbi:MAG: tetratricopeptide repeat protein [Candidatus Marithrix sp.]|nr:tetratricopeptide repeat protein [Candidatus Marithrix sp.]